MSSIVVRFILVQLISILMAIGACDSVNESGATETKIDTRSHIDASWSPDGTLIAFIASLNGVTGIYTVDTTGANIELIHSGPYYGTSWSPDGKWVASSQNGSLVKVQVTGDSVVTLTDSGEDFQPSWSPTGEWIAYNKTICDPYCGTLVVSASGNKISPVYQHGAFPSWNYSSLAIVCRTVNWTNNGRLLGYSYKEVSLDSAEVIDLFTLDTEFPSEYSRLSPVTDEILITSKPPGSYLQVMKIMLSARLVKQLTTDGGDMPAWSPDGRMIVYTRTQQGDGGLWIMNSDGSGKRRLTMP